MRKKKYFKVFLILCIYYEENLNLNPYFVSNKIRSLSYIEEIERSVCKKRKAFVKF